MIGKTLGHYRIVEQIGSGGMGIVYKAEDTMLGRYVALKLLPDDSRGSPVGRERLIREARAAAALNHPNICTVYEIGVHEGQHFIAMELLEGRTLKSIITGRPFKLELLLDFSIQIADGLEAAHSKGIIHRDIKPANIFVTSRSQVKLLDFGLAKSTLRQIEAAEVTDASRLPTAESDVLTSPGSVVGTTAYMSPEQARGMELDRRSDLFSLGAVLYEMATGFRPFLGDTAPVVFHAILSQDPRPPSRLNPAVPTELDWIISKALEKDRDVRYQDASDLRADLSRLKRDSESGKTAAQAPVVRGWDGFTRRVPTPGKWALAGLLLALLLGSTVFWRVWRNVHPQPTSLRETKLTANSSEYGVSFGSISPDGRYLAYTDRGGLHLKLIETGEMRTVAQPEGTTAENSTWVAGWWFPDGARFLATRYDAAGNFSTWVISVLGGAPRLVRDNADSAVPSPDGSQIAYMGARAREYDSSELWVMGAQGENPRKLLVAPEGESFNWQAWSPDSQRLAYLRFHGHRTTIESCSLHDGKATVILSDPSLLPWGIWWFPNGRFVFTSYKMEPNRDESTLWEMPVDSTAGRPLGPPRKITQWAGALNAIINGTTDGKRMVIMTGLIQADVYVGEWEPKARRLKNPRRLTFDDHDDLPGAWMKDSRTVLFCSNRNGRFDIFKQSIDRDSAETVVTGPNNKKDPILSPDGSLIVYVEDVPPGKQRIMRVPVAGGPPEMVMEGEKSIKGAACSSSPATRCVFAEENPDRKQCIFTEFDPRKGRGGELARIDLKQPPDNYFWALTSDGSRLAFAQDLRGGERRIRVLPLPGGAAREIVIRHEIQMRSLDWTTDGSGFLIGTCAPEAALLFVDMQGHSEVVWKTERIRELGPRGLPSPDGRYMALRTWTNEANLLMLENF